MQNLYGKSSCGRCGLDLSDRDFYYVRRAVIKKTSQEWRYRPRLEASLLKPKKAVYDYVMVFCLECLYKLDKPVPETPKKSYKDSLTDIHTEHCCEEHRVCKYGDDDCTVVTGFRKASFKCNCEWM